MTTNRQQPKKKNRKSYLSWSRLLENEEHPQSAACEEEIHALIGEFFEYIISEQNCMRKKWKGCTFTSFVTSVYRNFSNLNKINDSVKG